MLKCLLCFFYLQKLRQRIDKDDISMTAQNTHIVLVTGGTGCLGQHLIGLLQTHASYITEIRVLDLRPYENKLGKYIVT